MVEPLTMRSAQIWWPWKIHSCGQHWVENNVDLTPFIKITDLQKFAVSFWADSQNRLN